MGVGGLQWSRAEREGCPHRKATWCRVSEPKQSAEGAHTRERQQQQWETGHMGGWGWGLCNQWNISVIYYREWERDLSLGDISTVYYGEREWDLSLGNISTIYYGEREQDLSLGNIYTIYYGEREWDLSLGNISIIYYGEQ